MCACARVLGAYLQAGESACAPGCVIACELTQVCVSVSKPSSARVHLGVSLLLQVGVGLSSHTWAPVR